MFSFSVLLYASIVFRLTIAVHKFVYQFQFSKLVLNDKCKIPSALKPYYEQQTCTAKATSKALDLLVI